ncbi:MAG: TolB family protein [Solirubrobacteraceae bacterium]
MVNSASGRVYVAQGNFGEQVQLFGETVLVPDVTTEPVGSIDPKGAATLEGKVKPDEVALTECGFEYVDAAHYKPSASDPYAAGATVPCVPAAASIPVSGETEVSAQVTDLAPGGTYHFRLRAANANGANYGADVALELPPLPKIEAASATNITDSTADLNVKIDPGSLNTTYHFEYDTSPYRSDQPEGTHGTSVGEKEILAGAGLVNVGPVHLTELLENHTYYWRVVAANEAGTTIGADHVFVYDTRGGEGLPDNRAYEMVTPPHKNGALIGAGFRTVLPDISENGSRLVLSSVQCFAGSESCIGARQNTGEQFLFSRGSGGWITTALAPSATRFEVNSGWLANAETGMELTSSPTPPMSEDDFYVREPDGSHVDIGPTTPPFAGAQAPRNTFGAANMRATRDFSRVIFQEPHAWPFDESGGTSTYELAGINNTAPLLVGVSGGLGSTDVISKCETVLGSSETGNNPGELSADGETVYFTASACPQGGTGTNAGVPVPVGEVFARVGASRTVAISEPSAFSAAAPYPGCSEEPCVKEVNDREDWRGASFAGASNDGSKAFFTSDQQLSDDASAERNLYEYHTQDCGGEGHVIDVSAGDSSGHGSRVQGVVAIGADGSHVYFVARGVLTGVANAQGTTAKDGANNLYVFEHDECHAGGRISFVTSLPEIDSLQWNHNGSECNANVTSDGRFLVFESHADLTSDTTRTDGALQIFRYDALTGQLVRISVGENGLNDDGNAGSGDAKIVPAWKGAVNAGPSRADPSMSHDGSYIFFTSPVALTPHALNDVPVAPGQLESGYAENVYEWHEGHVYLISDGKDTAAIGDPDSSTVELLGSDGTGANVFFVTADRLLPEDTDTQIDYYDARICRPDSPCISPPPPPLPACLGEACHGTPAGTPPVQVGASATFDGQGNVSGASPGTVKAKKKQVARCAKGRRRVRGRCVKVKDKGGKARRKGGVGKAGKSRSVRVRGGK